MSTVLSVDNLSAGYGRALAVRDVSFEVDEGEVVALLGRNGAGKTSTLLTLSGILKARGGTVSVGGRVVAPGRPYAATKAGIAHVPEERALFSGLTVRENLIIAGARGKSELAEVYELFPELERLIDRRAGLLSGGEQQMLALARALRQRPKVLMVDEMSLGLAPLICARLVSILRGLADTTGIAVVLVEQHLELALEAADRGYVLRHGSVVMSGTRDDLLMRRAELESSYLGGAAEQRSA